MKSTRRLFRYFKKKTGIEMPQNILSLYKNNKNSNSEFIRLFGSHVNSMKKNNQPELRVRISEEFAMEILKLIHEYPLEERVNSLLQEIYDLYYEGRKISIDTSEEKCVAEEILYWVEDYNSKENRFSFPLIQRAYENLGSNPQNINLILILWAHCGGEGGIVVRGKNIGYDAGYTHGESSEIEFNGKTFEYEGYLSENLEKPHRLTQEN